MPRSTGLGAHFARMLAQRGWHVVLVARQLDALTAAKAEIDAPGGKADVVAMDVADETSVQAAFGEGGAASRRGRQQCRHLGCQACARYHGGRLGPGGRYQSAWRSPCGAGRGAAHEGERPR